MQGTPPLQAEAFLALRRGGNLPPALVLCVGADGNPPTARGSKQPHGTIAIVPYKG